MGLFVFLSLRINVFQYFTHILRRLPLNGGDKSGGGY